METQIVVAHRGASGLAPENTLLAHQVAYEVGAHMVEIDVQETADGELVCIHDYDVNRTTNGTGVVADLTYREIRDLDAGRGEKIPTLAQVLDYVRGKLKINIELKVTDVEQQVFSFVDERNMISDVMISSFLHGTLIATRSIDASISTAVLVSKIRDDMIPYVVELGANALNPDYRTISSDLMSEAHSNNIQVFPWTVNDSLKIQALLEMGVDGVITDFPDIAVKILKRINTNLIS
ncbi:glycerophosphodiester phosphodiesterase [Candidatus Thorarchaeota archaeon]|nr:MAG: glycerophosphodiester phosphodiesterase [Candidatus Thorarchaeota archaeon]